MALVCLSLAKHRKSTIKIQAIGIFQLCCNLMGLPLYIWPTAHQNIIMLRVTVLVVVLVALVIEVATVDMFIVEAAAIVSTMTRAVAEH